MKYLVAFGLALGALALWALFALVPGELPRPVTLAVEFALTDRDGYPLAGVPVRVAFAGQDWQAADAGQRLTTDANGKARFTAAATLDRQNLHEAIFTNRMEDHLLIAAEFERVVRLGGKDTALHWLMVSNVVGNSSTGIDAIYAKDAQGRFTRRLEPSREAQPMAARTDADSQAVASGAGYEFSDWLLERDASDPSGRHWHFKLGYKTLTEAPTTQMVAAAEAGDAARVKALLAAGADANGKRAYGRPAALFLAAKNNHLPVVQALLAAKADVDAKADRADNGYTALIAAAEQGHLEVVHALLAAGADVNARGEGGAAALFVAAEKNHLAVVQALIAAKADVNAKGYNDFTALVAARNSLPVVQALLAAGADVNAADKQGHTALGWARQSGRSDVVELLRQHGGHE